MSKIILLQSFNSRGSNSFSNWGQLNEFQKWICSDKSLVQYEYITVNTHLTNVPDLDNQREI